jgi:hypothetical protein
MRRTPVIAVALGCAAILSSEPVYAAVMWWRDIADQTVSTPIGPITLMHMRYLHQAGVYTLKGEAVNGTDRNWADLVLAVTLADKSGQVHMRTGWGQPDQPEMYIHLHGLQARGSQEFKFNPFAKADSDTLAPTIAYFDGDFPVVYRLGLIKPTPSDAASFETDRYALTFTLSDKGLDFTLKNKGDDPIRIDWNSVAYVDTTGQSQGVIHNGVKLVDRTAPKAPTLVPPGASIADQIVPVNNVELVNTEWVTHPLLPTGPAGLKAVGSQFSVFLPLEIAGKTENRSFVFKILGAS